MTIPNLFTDQFSRSLAVSKTPLKLTKKEGEYYIFKTRSYHESRLVLQTDKVMFFSPYGIVPFTWSGYTPLETEPDPESITSKKNAAPFTLIDQYMEYRLGPTGTAPASRALVDNLISSETYDRALKAATDMQRWDIAFMMLLKAYGAHQLHPSQVLWSRFPHESQLTICINNKILAPVGFAKTVIDHWWALHGGYHCHAPSLYVDWQDYKKYMASTLNPFVLSGVDPSLKPPTGQSMGSLPDTLTPKDLKDRTWFFSDGIAYLTDPEGRVLPYWYVTHKSRKVDYIRASSRAWNKNVRRQIERTINIPLHIARKVRSLAEPKSKDISTRLATP